MRHYQWVKIFTLKPNFEAILLDIINITNIQLWYNSEPSLTYLSGKKRIFPIHPVLAKKLRVFKFYPSSFGHLFGPHFCSFLQICQCSHNTNFDIFGIHVRQVKLHKQVTSKLVEKNFRPQSCYCAIVPCQLCFSLNYTHCKLLWRMN